MTAGKRIALATGVLAFGLALIAAVWFVFTDRARLGLAPDDFGRGDYRMVTSTGQPFTQDSLLGAPSLVFFGFTHCPDVCPTTLGDIALWQDELGAAGKDLRFFMISVDPTRDTPEILADYTGWLPNGQGVTGSEAESLKAQKAFRAFSRKVPLEGGDYTMDHSSSVLVFDAEGRFVTNISYQAPLEEALSRIRPVLGG